MRGEAASRRLGRRLFGLGAIRAAWAAVEPIVNTLCGPTYGVLAQNIWRWETARFDSAPDGRPGQARPRHHFGRPKHLVVMVWHVGHPSVAKARASVRLKETWELVRADSKWRLQDFWIFDFAFFQLRNRCLSMSSVISRSSGACRPRTLRHAWTNPRVRPPMILRDV